MTADTLAALAATLDRLAQIPELAREARDTWGTQPISNPGDMRHHVPGSIVLADLDRLLVLSGGNDRDGLGVLSTWVRAIAVELDEEGILVDLPADDVAEACDWLRARDRWIEDNPLRCDGLADDVRRLHSALRVICRVRADYTPRCRKCREQVIPINGTTRQRTDWIAAAYGFCLGCAETYPKGPALEALGRVQDFTLAEIAEEQGVNVWTLRDWAKQGLIEPTGRQGNAATYNLDVVMLLVGARRTA